MRYLEVYLDSKMFFIEHFRRVGDKAVSVSKALGRLIHNLRRPSEHKRRLCANVLASIILYGASIWIDELAIS